MKDREEFIESVWQKSEKAFAEEKRKKARRKKIGSVALAAACLTLIVGAVNFDKLYDKFYDSADMAFKEDLNELSLSNSPTEDYDSSNGDDGYRVSNNEGMQDSDSADSTLLGKPASAEKSKGGDTSGDISTEIKNEGTDSKDISSEIKNEITGNNCASTGNQCEVTRIVIENMNTADGVVLTGEKEISGYMKWFDGLPEELILTEGEYNKSENKIKVYYKFTIEKSTGEDAEAEKDAEAESETYYITGDVELP